MQKFNLGCKYNKLHISNFYENKCICDFMSKSDGRNSKSINNVLLVVYLTRQLGCRYMCNVNIFGNILCNMMMKCKIYTMCGLM